MLKEAIIAEQKIEHDYPCCWRCHKPVIFRATEQWFLKIEDLIPFMIKEAEKIKFVPEWAKKAFIDWLSNLKDNSITRQRFFGTPVPIWQCSCGKIFVVGSLKELEKLAEIPENLHRPWIDAVKIKCSCGSYARRIEDVLDVWLDSGTTSWNCLYFPKKKSFMKLFPADFILEATEQIKLWFSLLLICSTIAFRKTAFKAAYLHGMILDWKGRKMSKSLGNIVSPDEVIQKYGADVLRYYMCSNAAGQNMNYIAVSYTHLTLPTKA